MCFVLKLRKRKHNKCTHLIAPSDAYWRTACLGQTSTREQQVREGSLPSLSEQWSFLNLIHPLYPDSFSSLLSTNLSQTLGIPTYPTVTSTPLLWDPEPTYRQQMTIPMPPYLCLDLPPAVRRAFICTTRSLLPSRDNIISHSYSYPDSPYQMGPVDVGDGILGQKKTEHTLS